MLPNAWGAASARAVVAAGFPVVATTSGGVAATLGYADGQDAPPDQMFAAATRIARSVDAPVTIDSEAGYGLAPEVLVERLLDAGAAGCNLEDSDHAAGGLIDAQRHAEWLAAVRRRCHPGVAGCHSVSGQHLWRSTRALIFHAQKDGRRADQLWEFPTSAVDARAGDKSRPTHEVVPPALKGPGDGD
ncbi:MAG: isocitrate lyase/phosphoenolpyruvate mutase family protein [Candidatus Dormibacteria bacterium]